MFGLAFDEHTTVLLGNLELVERVESGSVLNITSGDIEAGYEHISPLSSYGLNQTVLDVPPCHGHVSLPSPVTTPLTSGAP